MANSISPIKTIYNEREQFIVIGLSGRTGAGCTEVSKILSTEHFSELNLHQPKSTDFDNSDERKYQIIYRYAEKHWHPFKRISMTDIIFSFILQNQPDHLEELLKSVFEEDINLVNILIEKIKGSDLWKTIEETNEKLNNYIGEDNRLKRVAYEASDDTAINECKLLDRLTTVQNGFREVFSGYQYDYTIKYEEKDKMGKIVNNYSEEITANAYTYLLQKIGNRIRHHGSTKKGIAFTGEHMYALARRANEFIKALRVVNRAKNEPTFVCLDAIRSPYEATYFQDRYAAFFLVAVSTDDYERKARLVKNLDLEQIQALDETEYPKKLGKIEQFTNQDIGACAQLADIYIYNPHEDTEEKFFVSELIVKYITLIKHPGLVTPSNIERCMQIAYNAKLHSGCLSRQVGAVITDKNYSVKAVGWNCVAEGQVPCNLRSVDNYLNNKDRGSFSTYELEDNKFCKHIIDSYAKLFKNISETGENINNGYTSINGRLFSYCFKDEYGKVTGEKNQVHTRSLHAEENAFLQIVKYGGEGIQGGNLFTSASSCVLCSKKAYQLGIKHIYYIDPYTDIANSHILSFGKHPENSPQCHLFYGAIGKAYTYLFTQRIPIKDELKALLETYEENHEDLFSENITEENNN